MSIADKLTTIAENELRVFEAGKLAGSGLKYTSGTVEFVSSYCRFYHNLGTIPRIIIIWTASGDTRENACLGCLYTSIMPKAMYIAYEDRAATSAPTFYNAGANMMTEITEISAVFSGRSGTYPVKQGITYNWLAIA